MTRKKKIFDSVELKNRIQAELLDEETRLGAAEAEKQRAKWLSESNDALAKWWRRVAQDSTAHEAKRSR